MGMSVEGLWSRPLGSFFSGDRAALFYSILLGRVAFRMVLDKVICNN